MKKICLSLLSVLVFSSAFSQNLSDFNKKAFFGLDINVGLKTRNLHLDKLNAALLAHEFVPLAQHIAMLSLDYHFILKNGLVLGYSGGFAKFKPSTSPQGMDLHARFSETTLLLGYQLKTKKIDIIPFVGLGKSQLLLTMKNSQKVDLNSFLASAMPASSDFKLNYGQAQIGIKLNYLVKVGKDKFSSKLFNKCCCKSDEPNYLMQKHIPIGLTFSYTQQIGGQNTAINLPNSRTEDTTLTNSTSINSTPSDRISSFSLGLSIGISNRFFRKL